VKAGVLVGPLRIQRKRTKGWRMPANSVYVGRPTKWGNPYRGPDAVSKFLKKMVLMTYTRRRAFLEPLTDKNLVCWCSLESPCHADVLLRMANQ